MNEARWVASVLVQSTVITLCACAAARWLAPRHAALRHAILLGGLACLGLAPFVAMVAPRLGLTAVSAPDSQRSQDPLALHGWEPTGSTAIEVTASAPSPDVSATPRDLMPWLGAIWALGVLVQLVRLAHGWYQVVRIRARATPMGAGVAISTDVAGPLALGLRRPLIVLPKSLLEHLSELELRDVLMHERAHVARHDVLVGLVQRLLGAAYWFHPLVHLLNRELSRAREEVCDDHVLATRARTDYARTLLASVPDAAPPGLTAALGLWWPRFCLSDRIAGLLDERRVTMTRPRFWQLLVIVLASASAVAAMAATSPPPPAAVGSESIDLGGEWHGVPWGKVFVRGDVAKYERGMWRFARTGRRSFSGYFQESDGYGGTLRFTVSADGAEIHGSFDVDEHAERNAGVHEGFTIALKARLPDRRSALEGLGYPATTDEEKAARIKAIEGAKADLEKLAAMDRSQLTPADLEKLATMEALAKDKLAEAESREKTPVDRTRARIDLERDHAKLAQAYDAACNQHGKNHQESLALLEQLAFTTVRLGALEEGLELLRRAVEGNRALLGSEHPQTLAALQRLAEVELKAGRVDDAKSLLQELLATRQKQLGVEHPTVLETRLLLAHACESSGDLRMAEDLLLTVLDGATKTLGAEHPLTERCRGNLVRLLEKQGRTEEAARISKQKKGAV